MLNILGYVPYNTSSCCTQNLSETVKSPLAQEHFTAKEYRATRNIKTSLYSNFEKLKNTATLLFKMEQEQPLVHKDCDCV
jgi:hypothetical protein